MSIEIKDFRKLEGKEKDDAIYQMLISLSEQIIPPDATLDKKIALVYPRDKEMRIPLGYEICDGKNMTDDLRSMFTDKVVYIQRVK